MATKKAPKKAATKKKPRRVHFINPRYSNVREEYRIVRADTPEDLSAQINALRADARERREANRALFVDIDAHTPIIFNGREYLQKVEIYECVKEAKAKRNPPRTR
jgi:hypothetical protein